MADNADKACLTETGIKEKTIENIRAAADIPKGRPGDCDLCGEWSSRLVSGVCAPCRDRHGLD